MTFQELKKMLNKGIVKPWHTGIVDISNDVVSNLFTLRSFLEKTFGSSVGMGVLRQGCYFVIYLHSDNLDVLYDSLPDKLFFGMDFIVHIDKTTVIHLYRIDD